MGVAEAQQWYDLRPGDPATRYISPDDAKASVSQIYSDMSTALYNPNTVGTAQLIDGAATANKIADGAITTSKLSSNLVIDGGGP